MSVLKSITVLIVSILIFKSAFSQGIDLDIMPVVGIQAYFWDEEGDPEVINFEYVGFGPSAGVNAIILKPLDKLSVSINSRLNLFVIPKNSVLPSLLSIERFKDFNIGYRVPIYASLNLGSLSHSAALYKSGLGFGAGVTVGTKMEPFINDDFTIGMDKSTGIKPYFNIRYSALSFSADIGFTREERVSSIHLGTTYTFGMW